MSQLIDNLNIIESVKTDIKSAIEAKGVDMTGVSFPGYASKIGEITTSFVTVPLNVSANGTYNPGEGIDGYSQVVVDVPQSVTGYTQKEITEGLCITDLNNSASFVGKSAFVYNSCLTTVDLPMCETVGDDAFKNCTSLQTVSLPVCSNVGNYALQGCTSLQTVSLPVCSTVGNYAFQGCSSLQTVSLPVCSNVSHYAFYGCFLLQTVSLPVCTSIKEGAFNYCTSLSVAYIGTGIDIVCVLGNSNVFSGCSALTSIYVPTSLVESYKAATNWTFYSDKIVGI